MASTWHPAILLGTAAAVTGSGLLACATAGATTARPAVSNTPSESSAQKRVLVTGCSGSIGRPVCAWLTACGHTVVGFDSVPAAPDTCSQSIVGDICDASTQCSPAATFQGV